MSTPKIFFSYSRLDSGFALQLAKDIREAGADIWIDQLDIPAGIHWDAAVEKALAAAACVLVILTPASTASNNVKDEISFALDSGRIIIPVLLEECHIPFRLHRLQSIDFTKDYATGLKQLLYSVHRLPSDPANEAELISMEDDELTILQPVVDPFSQDVPLNGETINRQKKSFKERFATTLANKKYLNSFVTPKPVKKLFSKTSAIMAASVLALALVWGFAANSNPPEDKEEKAWNDVSLKLDTAALKLYLASFPEGKYSGPAKHLLDSLLIRQSNPSDSSKAIVVKDSLSLVAKIPVVPETPDTIKKSIVAQKSKSIVPVAKPIVSKFKLGQSMEGGSVAYIQSNGLHGIIVADKDLGSLEYSIAAKRCAQLKSNGFDDWRLPTKEELNLIYKNRKLIHPFTSGMYWSSTDVTTAIAWTQNLKDGNSGNFNKAMECNVIAVRSF